MSHATRGTDTASQRRVVFEGVCRHVADGTFSIETRRFLDVVLAVVRGARLRVVDGVTGAKSGGGGDGERDSGAALAAREVALVVTIVKLSRRMIDESNEGMMQLRGRKSKQCDCKQGEPSLNNNNNNPSEEEPGFRS